MLKQAIATVGLIFLCGVKCDNSGSTENKTTQVTVESVREQLTMALHAYYKTASLKAKLRSEGKETCKEIVQSLQTDWDKIKEENAKPVILTPDPIMVNVTIYRTLFLQQHFFFDCNDVYNRGYNLSGVFPLWLRKGYSFVYVYCDVTINCPDNDSCSWIVIQRRKDNTIDFNRERNIYIQGFGIPTGEHWIGLGNLAYIMTQRVYDHKDRKVRLRIDIQDIEGTEVSAEYDDFQIDGRDPYTITSLGNGTGKYPGLMPPSLNRPFEVRNLENQADYPGGWWFADGDNKTNLNAPYESWLLKERQTIKKIYVVGWDRFNSNNSAVKSITMKIKYY